MIPSRRNEPPPRVAVIDLGTNTALMTVLFADERDRRRLRVAEELHFITGLGRDRGIDGRLAPAGKARALRALKHFGTRLDALGIGINATAGAATAAVREAPDGAAFLDEVEALIGLRLRTVSGDEEAELVALAQERSFPGRLPLRVVDIGGGSTEVAVRLRGTTSSAISLRTGSVRLAERHGSNVEALRPAVQRALEELPSDLERAALVGVAGTVTTALQAARGIDPWDPDLVHGQSLGRAELEATIERLAAMTPEQRAAVPGVHPGRAELIVAGMVLLAGLMQRFAADEVLVSDRGVRFGLLFEQWPLATVL
ncbi:MAG: Ppx/GppA family phosphatase [Proteobacteria bacterium]|nr:Ppx/GppA family phosphatase [Pseudomonadota bacterium]